MKADIHTNEDTHQYSRFFDNNNQTHIIEFIIDKANMDISLRGNNFIGKPPYLQGIIIRIERLSMTALGD